MAKREFLQLAHNYDRKKTSVGGWLMSEKLDGMRGFWDGGISRGMPASLVPWANTAKDYIKKDEVIATGLWTRYGKVIHAHKDWLDHLPNTPLDGELYMGRNMFQKTVSITKRHNAPLADWMKVSYMAFDTPPLEKVFADGEINNTNFKRKFKGIMGWIAGRGRSYFMPPNVGFMGRYKALRAVHGNTGNPVVCVHVQEELPFATKVAEARMDAYCMELFANGGEGVILKSQSGLWEPERSYQILKHKECRDAEATVMGYTFGKETELGSKLLGMMGALYLKNDKGTFKCSGFTDEERVLKAKDGSDGAFGYGVRHPGEDVPNWIHNPRFPCGTTITYKFRETTDAGLPKEARFFRERDDG